MKATRASGHPATHHRHTACPVGVLRCLGTPRPFSTLSTRRAGAPRKKASRTITGKSCGWSETRTRIPTQRALFAKLLLCGDPFSATFDPIERKLTGKVGVRCGALLMIFWIRADAGRHHSVRFTNLKRTSFARCGRQLSPGHDFLAITKCAGGDGGRTGEQPCAHGRV